MIPKHPGNDAIGDGGREFASASARSSQAYLLLEHTQRGARGMVKAFGMLRNWMAQPKGGSRPDQGITPLPVGCSWGGGEGREQTG